MNNLPKTALLLLTPLFLAGCGSKNFTEFLYPDGGFKILAPAKPQEKAQASPFGKMKMYGYQETDGAFAVAYIDPSSGPGQGETTLDEAVKGLAANVHGNVTNQTRVQHNGRFAGRDVLIELAEEDQLLHARIYLVNGRLYEVTSLGKKSWVESEETIKFLDSFTPLEQKKESTPP